MNNLNGKKFTEGLEYNTHLKITTIMDNIFEIHMIIIYSKSRKYCLIPDWHDSVSWALS